MKFGRFTYHGEVHYGVMEKNTVTIIEGDPLTDWVTTSKKISLDDTKPLAPVTPKNIIGIGANYVQEKQALPEEIPVMPVFSSNLQLLLLAQMIR